jgi:pantoate--beta-alanine ligase
MIVARSRKELAEGLAELRASHGGITLVPTMGALHEGHLSLVDRAKESGGAVVVTIFVNPLQFGLSEDLGRYPRDEAGDLRTLGERGVDLVFVPGVEVVYPDGSPSVTVDPGPMADVLCGPWRPGHFRGVLTVVAKIFGLVRPDQAVFGRKDYQQAVLIRRMVRDLDLGVGIQLAPIVREPDGLAMSSRNAYLTPEERRQAPELFRALTGAREAFASGERRSARLKTLVQRRLEGHSLIHLQYVDVVDQSTLESVEEAGPDEVALLAALCGATRLIDNVVLGASS